MPEPTRGEGTIPHQTKLFSRERTIIYLVHNIPFQALKKNTLKFNIIIINIKYTI